MKALDWGEKMTKKHSKYKSIVCSSCKKPTPYYNPSTTQYNCINCGEKLDPYRTDEVKQTPYLTNGIAVANAREILKLKIDDLCEKLSFSNNVRKEAHKLANKIKITRKPSVIAVSCVYLTSKEKNEQKTQAEIAITANITEVALRNGFREILRQLTFLNKEATT